MKLVYYVYTQKRIYLYADMHNMRSKPLNLPLCTYVITREYL